MLAPTLVSHPHVVKQPDYCGGKATIDDTRVRVMNVVFLHKQGKSEAEILETYPDVNRAQMYAALTYYYDHLEEIEAELRADEGAGARYEQERTADLDRRAPE
jgi:uncharacterized protein (DUF433 family)